MKEYILGYMLISGKSYLIGCLEQKDVVEAAVIRHVNWDAELKAKGEPASGATWACVHIDNVVTFLKGKQQ